MENFANTSPIDFFFFKDTPFLIFFCLHSASLPRDALPSGSQILSPFAPRGTKQGVNLLNAIKTGQANPSIGVYQDPLD